MVGKVSVSGTIFTALGNEKINVKVIAQSPDELNIIIGVACEDYERAIQVLYKNLIK
jgi:aspartate kinase